MHRQSFAEGWTVRPKGSEFTEIHGSNLETDVTLPHDAIINTRRDPDTGEGAPTAFHTGGTWEYRKTFFVPEEHAAKRVMLEFEGIYRSSLVYINDSLAGRWAAGYTGFTVELNNFLRFGEDNTVRVEARAHLDSRWYSGGGIHRPVHLIVADPLHVALDGIIVTTPDIGPGRATVILNTSIQNQGTAIRSVWAHTRLLDANGIAVGADRSPVTIIPGEDAVIRQRILVHDPALWSTDLPSLYVAEVELRDGDDVLDTADTTFGIRHLQLDVERGLQINGQEVKLRGACVHHDNGILGAAAIDRADERRVELLKAAGFNALRSAHNPMSRAMLDACDRVGMLVMDEAFDSWTRTKTDYDYALDFETWWERDLEAMIVKDRNHPSVFAYSIGNEIPELATTHGAIWARRLAVRARELDGTRFVTSGINGALTVLPEVIAQAMEEAAETPEVFEGMGINTFMANMADMNNQIGASQLVTDRTAEAFAALDIAGMNYLDARYELDRELFPNRVIVGAETFPTRIDHLWALVQRFPHVIGDFTWTGWDYLGEVGVGRPIYEGDTHAGSLLGPYPWLVAGVGDLDITGHRRPVSFYREIVFGQRAEPYIAVQRPEMHGRQPASSPWAWSDAIASWTWAGQENKPVTVEVYSDADEVELLVNDEVVGRSPAGPAHRFRATFETTYAPGIISAVAYRDGRASEQTELYSASGTPRLSLVPDRGTITFSDRDAAFVSIELVDQSGTVFTGADCAVTLSVEGPGTLHAFGSADPINEATYASDTHATFEGRALAIIRPTGVGPIRVAASTSHGWTGSVEISVVERDSRKRADQAVDRQGESQAQIVWKADVPDRANNSDDFSSTVAIGP